VIDNLLNLVFRCRHRRLSRPMTPAPKPGQGRQEAYVVCLDCGKQFRYDLDQMRLGKAVKSV
jgi:DNA-directed RNA polymerase subunit RPC12/RpoP